jgi:hypothetical protein
MVPPHRYSSVVLLAPLVREALGAGLIEDHTASWLAAGLNETLAAGHDDALPRALFRQVATIAPTVIHETADGHQQYKFNKRNTWWFPLFASDQDAARATKQGSTEAVAMTRPRSAIEAAVHALFALDFGGAPTPIVGAEWWIQEQEPAADIGFHYDKDEAYASEHMTMRFPEVSTVTYLTEVGAPTVVFNQTTPDGNEEVPPLPETGAIVHPNPNKHLVFRGNLQHGVSGELSRWYPGGEAHGAAPRGEKRRTLLINWWRQAPMAPNCVPFGEERWSRLGMLLSEPTIASLSERLPSREPQALQWAPMDTGVGDGKSPRRVVVTIAPTDMLHFDFPPVADIRAGNWRARWSRGEAAGPLTRLDLNNRRSTQALFADKRPKLFLVLPTHAVANWAGTLPAWAGALCDEFGHRLRVVVADPDTTLDFLKQFGLKAADAPTAAIHDTSRQAKYLIKERPLRKAALWRFVRGFLDGQLEKEEL